jgi:jumonji domain-containing protein 7
MKPATTNPDFPLENDNLRDEYSALYDDVEADIVWARVALEQAPDAINLWIGNSRSVTALHRDNYENVYCQIMGSKHFVLLPPIAMPCVNEQMLQPATYVVRYLCASGDFADVFRTAKDEPRPSARS